MSKQSSPHKSKIGGQALFEGIMMRGPRKEAMAVRKKDGTIHIESIDVPSNKWYQKTPFVRGVFNFILQMKNGYGYLMKSFDISGYFDDEDDGKEEKDEENKENAEQEEKPAQPNTTEEKETKVLESVVGVIGVIGGVALSIFLFMFLPAWSFTQFAKLFDGDINRFQALFEGIIRIILFVVYMWAVSLMKEIRTTYEYHGAEHKTIAAYEAGETLDPEHVENIKKYTRFHPRCGTSFIFLVLAVSILVYSVVQFFLPISSADIAEYLGVNNIIANLIRTAVKLSLLPLLVGITYEIIKLAGRYDTNIIMRIISAPGLGLQRLTTCEPNEKQLQVAVSAMLPVIPENKEEDKW